MGPHKMNRREWMKLSAGAALGMRSAMGDAFSAETQHAENVEQWGTFEATFHGPSSGNPFTDTRLTAQFTLQHRTVEVAGFYDGEGTYRVRFMPDMQGAWSYETESNAAELHGKRGSFRCVAPSPDNHGPVQVAHQYHFQYADGVPYFPFGTTCYSLAFLGEDLENETLQTLKSAPFNKVRMCLLPKPVGSTKLFAYPFERDATGKNDYMRPVPEYFRHIERRIQDLQKLGIEADVILFHPYDAWGYKAMPAEADDNYLRYAIARLSAYRNVWWSLANEYDLVKTKTPADWDRFFRIVVASDPYSHLRSIHYSGVLYDYSKPWVTHASLQNYQFEKAAEWREAWRKPIIYDEIQYEGNIARRWGNLSAQEMMRRFWLAIVAGTYATHGETYISTDGKPVWSDGGTLHGTSPERIGFLRKLVEESTRTGLNEFEGSYYLSAGTANELYLWFFDYHQPAEHVFPLTENTQFQADLIDPWEMTIKPVDGRFSGKSKLQLPGKPYQAVRFRKA
jgi:hypothetical protein